MKIAEIITEWSHTDFDIIKALKKKGYKYLGRGVDQTAFVEPSTGYVLKIFGTQQGTSNTLTKDHQMFFDWYEFCQKNKGNPFLPQFYGHDSFTFKGHRYLQFRTERMFPLTSELGYAVEAVANHAMRVNNVEKFIRDNVDRGEYQRDTLPHPAAYQPGDQLAHLVAMLGKAGLVKLYNTIRWVVEYGRKKRNYKIDLHSGNFMLGHDGEIVINDPWVSNG